MLTTGWDDRSPHMETYWRGFIASAYYSWNTNGGNLSDYHRAYMQREFGPDAFYTELYVQLRDAAYFWETSLVKKGNRMENENALFELPGIAHWVPEDGREDEKKQENFEDIVIDLPNLNQPGQWTKKYKERLKEAEQQAAIYKSTSQQLVNLYEVSTRNTYHWRLFAALNDFQITAPRLLTALKGCDVDDESKRNIGFLEVRKALAEFKTAWVNLNEVYGETRHVAYPKNYVADRYFHFASQREDLTWLVQVEELLHPQVVKWVEANLKK